MTETAFRPKGEPEDHKAAPKPGTLYSETGINTGLPADERFPGHYPMTGHCEGCGEIIRVEWHAEIGVAGWWLHTGRRPGELRRELARAGSRPGRRGSFFTDRDGTLAHRYPRGVCFS